VRAQLDALGVAVQVNTFEGKHLLKSCKGYDGHQNP
jgi:hypothetical protein